MKVIKGLIWYADGYYAGTEDEYENFIQTHKAGKLVYSFNEIDLSQLHKLCNSLNESSQKKNK